METTDKVYLYGASGHAKVILDMLLEEAITVPCLIDDNPSINELAGISVIHSAEGLFPIIVSIGDCRIRRRIVEKLSGHQFNSVIHRAASVSKNSRIGEGTVVMAGAIIQPGTSIGHHCIINTGASVDHDAGIGNFVHVAPHYTLCGGVEVGEGTWIGAGTMVIQRIHIDRDCFIGAGSVVVSNIPDGSLCYGNPARIIRKINQDADNKCIDPVIGRGKIAPSIYAALIKNAA